MSKNIVTFAYTIINIYDRDENQNDNFVYFLMLLTACGQSYEEKLKQNSTDHERMAKENAAAFKVAVMPTLDCMPVYLAKQKHWFDSTVVDVRLRVYNAQMDCDTALKGNSVEVAITDIKRVEHLIKTNVNLVSLGHTGAYWQLISNRTARIKTPSQLGDKMVAMTRYSATDYLTDRLLKNAKVSAPVFKVQINDVLIRLDMLINNEMDAMWLPEPQATTARIYKHTLMEDSRQIHENIGVVAARYKLLKDKKKAKQLAAFIKGYNRACDSLNLYGVRHYSYLVEKACHTNSRTIEKLPKFSFPNISFPQRQ